MSEEILGGSNQLSNIINEADMSVLFSENTMEVNHQDANGAMENLTHCKPEPTEHTEIKPEPMDSEPLESRESCIGTLELIPFVEHIKTEEELQSESDVGQSKDQDLNPQQTEQLTENQQLIEDHDVKVETEFEATEERTELNTLEDQFREEINHTLRSRDITMKTEDPSDSIVEYDYPQFSMDSSDSRIHKTEIDTEIGSEFMTYDSGQDAVMAATQINTNSTITQPPDINQQTGNDQESILPSTENSMLKRFIEEKTITEENYMLNSITGDALPLEHYALDRPFMCTQCPKTYREKASLIKHLRLHETLKYNALKKKIALKKRKLHKDIVYRAKIKVSASEVNKEKLIGQQEYKCTCGKSYYRKIRMETCWKSHNEVYEELPSFDCVTCKKGFLTSRELATHNRNVHIRKKFPCKFCPAEFHIRKHLVKHLTQHRKLQLAEYHVMSEFIKKKHKKIKCFICKKGYEEILDLKVHVSSAHSEEIKCTFCKQNMKYSEFFVHTKKMHQENFLPIHELHEAYYKLTQAWQCEECYIKFFKADEYAMHRVEKHSNSVSNTVRETDHSTHNQCNSCQRVFTSAKSLNSHSRIHHNIEEKEQPKGTNLICVYCRKVCTEDTLESHMRFHSSERKYACRYCDYRFATTDKRKKHAEIHKGKLKFICFICEYRCSSEHRLELHKMSSKHQSVKDHLLNGKALPNQSSNRIEKVRDDDKNSNESSSESSDSDSDQGGFECDICGEKFNTNKKMLRHKQTHPFIEFPNDDTPTRIFFK